MTRTNSSFLRLAPLALALACEAAGGIGSTDQPQDDADDGEPAGTSESSGPGPTGPGHDVGPGPAFQCDPWQQDCPEGQKCNLYSLDGDDTLDGAKCVPLGEGGQIYDACTAANDCDRGLMCSPPDAAPMCQPSPGGGCCLPYCELGGVCPDGLECYDFEDPNEPPEQIDLGACGLVP